MKIKQKKKLLKALEGIKDLIFPKKVWINLFYAIINKLI